MQQSPGFPQTNTSSSKLCFWCKPQYSSPEYFISTINLYATYNNKLNNVYINKYILYKDAKGQILLHCRVCKEFLEQKYISSHKVKNAFDSFVYRQCCPCLLGELCWLQLIWDSLFLPPLFAKISQSELMCSFYLKKYILSLVAQQRRKRLCWSFHFLALLMY